MLNLESLPTTAAMRLAGATPKRVGAGMAWTFEFAMEIPDEEDAEIVESYVPGTLSAYQNRAEGKGTITASGNFPLLRVVLSGDDGHLASGPAEVQSAKVSVNNGQAVLSVKVRVTGLIRERAANVVYCLDESLTVNLRAVATQLSLLAPVLDNSDGEEGEDGEGKTRGPAGDYDGKLVSCKVADGSGVIAGIVVAQDEGKLIIATLESGEPVTHDLADGSPATSMDVGVGDGQDLREVLGDYVDLCEDNRIPASWAHIVEALGQLYAESVISPEADFSWRLTPQVFNRAYTLAGGELEEASTDEAGDSGSGEE